MLYYAIKSYISKGSYGRAYLCTVLEDHNPKMTFVESILHPNIEGKVLGVVKNPYNRPLQVGSQVVAKVIANNSSEASMKTMLNEVDAFVTCGSKHNPHIVGYYESFRLTSGDLVIIMQYCGGGELHHQIVERGRYREAVRAYTQKIMAAGLDYSNPNYLKYVKADEHRPQCKNTIGQPEDPFLSPVNLYYPFGSNVLCPMPRYYFSEDHVLGIQVQLQIGLSFIHEQNVIHRDIKSANVFLMKPSLSEECPRVLIGDFGVAKLLEHTLAMAATQIGTPYNQAPEIFKKKDYDNRADVWSVGVVFYEQCSLKRPFDGKSIYELFEKVRRAKVHSQPRHYSSFQTDVTCALLTKNPADRPTTLQILSDIRQRKYVEFYLTAEQVGMLQPQGYLNYMIPSITGNGPSTDNMTGGSSTANQPTSEQQGVPPAMPVREDQPQRDTDVMNTHLRKPSMDVEMLTRQQESAISVRRSSIVCGVEGGVTRTEHGGKCDTIMEEDYGEVEKPTVVTPSEGGQSDLIQALGHTIQKFTPPAMAIRPSLPLPPIPQSSNNEK